MGGCGVSDVRHSEMLLGLTFNLEDRHCLRHIRSPLMTRARQNSEHCQAGSPAHRFAYS